MGADFIYLDNSATTRICDEALKAYNDASLLTFGNPSSLHGYGFEAEKAMNAARSQLLSALGTRDHELIFTSSGSEANNLAIIGRAFAKERYRRGAKIITTDGEHASVNEPLKRLESEGFRIARISTRGGRIDMDELEGELDSSVILVTMMMVNNETGALYDLRAVAELMKRKSPEAVMHVDATQSFMKLPFSPASISADMVTISSHKIAGPKGVGALAVSKRLITSRGLAPIIYGGGQELGLRSGTENVPGICAFGEAARIAKRALFDNAAKMDGLRAYLIERLEGELTEISITKPWRAAPHILNITLPRIKSETMLHFLSSRGIYVSSGSACSSNSRAHSSALVAFGRSEAEADTSIRISFAPTNTRDDVDKLIVALGEGIRSLSRIR